MKANDLANDKEELYIITESAHFLVFNCIVLRSLKLELNLTFT